MKRIIWIPLFVACALGIGLAGWRWFSGAKPSPDTSSQTFSKSTAKFNGKAPTADESQEKNNDDNQMSDEQAIKKAQEWGVKGNVPIKFYGEIIDQDGAGIPGVKVKASVTAFDETYILHPDTSDGQARTVLERMTNEEGLFVIDGVKGERLFVQSLEKAGYQVPQVTRQQFNASFEYSSPDLERHIPDAAKPVIYRMWREVGGEPLVKAEMHCKMGVESKVYTIDLLKQKQVEGTAAEGDFQVQLKRPLETKVGVKCDWSVMMQAVDGGIVPASDPFLNEAPDSGYFPSFELVMNTSDPNWSDHISQNFYLKSRNGKVYASLKINAYLDLSHYGVIEIDYLANPAGSRNLEFDPSKQINKQSP